MLTWISDYVLQIAPYADSLGFYFYIIVFAVAAFESTPIIGTFTPGSFMLAFIGFMVSMSNISLVGCILGAALGGVAGDYIAYLLGRFGGRFFKDNKGLLKISHLEMGKAFFTVHGGKSIFIGRFVGPIRPIVPLVAGATHMSMNRFLPLNLTSAIIWASILIGAGYFLGEQWKSAEEIFTIFSIVATILVIAIVGRWYIRKKTLERAALKGAGVPEI